MNTLISNTFEGIESYLKLKNDDSKGKKVILSFFSLNTKEKILIQKICKESLRVISCSKGEELITFTRIVETNDKSISDFPIGFEIITKSRKFVLFASSKLIYTRWIESLFCIFKSNPKIVSKSEEPWEHKVLNNVKKKDLLIMLGTHSNDNIISKHSKYFKKDSKNVIHQNRFRKLIFDFLKSNFFIEFFYVENELLLCG